MAPFHFGELAQGNGGGSGHLAQRATLILPATTQFFADNFAHHNHGATSCSYSPTITAHCGFPLAQACVTANLHPAGQGTSRVFTQENACRG